MKTLSPEHLALWQRLDQFELDEPSSERTFTLRLAQENRWELGYAVRAVYEYKRFMFLAIAAGHPVSPSDAVDEAWHLHLLYSRSYWEEFCPKVLGRSFHHIPSTGGANEAVKHQDWYAKTLASYRAFFGEAPPPDIWPDAVDRAREIARARPVRVDSSRVWIVPKLEFNFKWPLRVACAIFSLIFLSGCSDNSSWPLNLRGPDFLVVYICFCVGALLLAIGVKSLFRGPGGMPMEMPKLTPHETAYLAGKGQRIAETVLTKLVGSDRLKIDATGKRLTPGASSSPDTDPLERKIVSYINAGGNPTSAASAVVSETNKIRQHLIQQELIVNEANATLEFMSKLAILGFPLILGLFKMSIGLSIGKPIAFLVILSIIMVIASIVVLQPAHLTRRGAEVLNSLMIKNASLKKGVTKTSPPDAQSTAVALYGPVVLNAAAFGMLGTMLRPPPSSGGGCSGGGGSGCGGGGCGGGGCGGCGGGD